MGRVAIAAVVAAVLAAAVAAPAAAEHRDHEGDRDGHSRRHHHERGRVSAREQRLRIDERLTRLQGPPVVRVEYATPYLPSVDGDRGVDQQIRRLGDWIRSQEAAGR